MSEVRFLDAQGVTLYASETNFPNSNGCNNFRQKRFVSVLLRR